MTTEDRPRLYYWSVETTTRTSAESGTPSLAATFKSQEVSENELYSVLGRYLQDELGLWPKRIDQRAAFRKTAGANVWLFPDLVAMELLTGADWPSQVQELWRKMTVTRARLWSFEVKIQLDRSNARDAFFQAVANSSWANFGYLVAPEIKADDTLDELRVLGDLHGIGVIRLDVSAPSESEILVPARARAEVDWASLARLAADSADMRDFVEAVSRSVAAGQPLKHAFDYVGN